MKPEVLVSLALIILMASLAGGEEREIQVASPQSAPKPELVIQNGHHAEVSSVIFSPDGKLLASGGNDALKLWEAKSGRLLWSRVGHVSSLSFFPDGQALATAGASIYIRDIKTGRVLRSLKGHKVISFSPDGKLLASGGCDKSGYETNCKRGSVKLWNPQTGGLLRILDYNFTDPTSLDFSPDGKLLVAVGGWDSWGFFLTNLWPEKALIKIWEAESGRILWSQETPSDYFHKRPTSVAFDPEGKLMAVGSNDTSIKLFSLVRSGEGIYVKLLRTLEGHSSQVTSVAFSPDGKVLASGSKDNTVMLWEVDTGRPIKSLAGHSSFVRSVAFHPDGKTLASGGDDKTVRLWDLETGQVIRTMTPHSFWIENIALSPDGKVLASTSYTSIKLWSMEGSTKVPAGQPLRTIRAYEEDLVRDLAFSPDGKILASGAWDRTIKLWEVNTGRLIRVLRGHTSFVQCLDFSPDGKLLASGAFEKRILLWDVETGEIIHILPTPNSGSIDAIAFSPDGKLLATACSNATIKLWDVNTGQLIQNIEGNLVQVISFSPDGKLLASGDLDKMVRVFEVPSGQLFRAMKGHSDFVTSVAFRPDGKLLVSASRDQTIKFWQVETGELLMTRILEGYDIADYSVTFSRDGKLLLSAGSDTKIKFWDLESGRLLCSLLPLDREDWVHYAPEGYFDASGKGADYIGWTVGLKNYSFEQFRHEYYRPGLFSRVIRGERMAGKKDLREGFAPPPEVMIRQPREGEKMVTDKVEVIVEAVDTGGGVRDLRLYHQGQPVVGAGEDKRTRAVVIKTFIVTLTEGENILRATAFSEDNLEALPSEIRVHFAAPSK